MIFINISTLICAVLLKGALTECPENCIFCKNAWFCNKCAPEKFLHFGYCYSCPENCKKCANSTFCTECKPGFYGRYCLNDCNLCTDGVCDLLSCKYGCKPGYYRNVFDNESRCSVCSKECKYCTNYYNCSVCNNGFYLRTFPGSGTFFKRCSSGRSASKNNCSIKNCKTCKVPKEEQSCSECYPGYKNTGDRCVLNITVCSEGCSTTCDSSGVCLGSCTDGWTGDECTDFCPTQCLKCDKTNPKVCHMCSDGFYTRSCSLKCPSSCKRHDGVPTCSKEKGYCLNECKNNFWGNFCNMSCSLGCATDMHNDNPCNRNDGKCKNGCKEGYFGDNCERDASASPSTRDFDKEPVTTRSDVTILKTRINPVATISTETASGSSDKNNCEENSLINKRFYIGYVSGIGTSVVTATVIICLCCLRKRYVSSKCCQHNDDPKTTASTIYYNVTSNGTRKTDMTQIDKNKYDSLHAYRNTEIVYKELEISVV